ncbi:MAG: FtsW/RodA/SpoVE family cell cycle protein [Phycisphaeraceae bacterium]
MQGILEQLRQVFRPHVGWYGVLAAVGLTALGVAAIDTVDPGSAARQARFWLPVAFLAMAAAMLPHPRWIGEVTYPAALAILLLLVFVILPFAPRALVPVRNGATCWIDLGPVSLQPAELAKIAFVLALARYFRYRDSYRTLRGLLVPFVIMFIPVGLLLKQPDLGTALLFAPSLMAMLVAAGAKLRHLSALVAIGIVAIGVNVAIVYYDAPDWMHVLKPHQEARIAAMIWPEKHRQDDAYQPPSPSSPPAARRASAPITPAPCSSTTTSPKPTTT